MSNAPSHPTEEEWDAIVVGTGMGGSTLGYALAKAGHKVLFVEKGNFLFGDFDRGNGKDPVGKDDSPETRLERGWWPEKIEGETNHGKIAHFAPLGCGTGGSTSVYAAQLERLSPADFSPGANHPDVGSTVPEHWPISYDDLAPFYRQAETLFDVCGTEDPLLPDAEQELREPPPLSDRDRDLFESFSELGLHPFRAHVGFQFIEGCEECGGALCPHACRSDAGRICLLPALQQYGARILERCEVTHLEADATRVTGVQCQWRGEEITLRAKRVVLAAGAYMTPGILLRSRSSHWPDGLANRSGQVGRNLMMHTSDFIAMRPRRQLSSKGPRKAIALNDFLFKDGVKMGTLQSVGIQINPGYVLYFLRSLADRDPKWWLSLGKPFFRIVARIAAFYYRKAAVFASIVEDLPYADNRITLDPEARNGMRYHYDYPRELLERNHRYRKELHQVLGQRHKVVVLSGDNNLNYGHVCGTCRFGDDPATSVLDRENRAHGVENLYAVDASFFPSSGSNNPSLTIAANALRVAETIDRGLRA